MKMRMLTIWQVESSSSRDEFMDEDGAVDDGDELDMDVDEEEPKV